MYVVWIHLNVCYFCWVFLSVKCCSLLTSFFSLSQVPEAVQNSAAVLTSLSNSPQAKTCEKSVTGAEKMLSRRSRSIRKTPERQERVNVTTQQNDNCQVQWLAVMPCYFPELSYHISIICRMFLTLDSCTGFLAFVHNIQGQLYYICSYFLAHFFILFFIFTILNTQQLMCYCCY